MTTTPKAKTEYITSAPMDKGRAKLLAETLAANPHITHADVRKDKTQAEPLCYVVRWASVHGQAGEPGFASFQLGRIIKAQEEMLRDVISFYPVENVPGQYFTVNDDLHGELHHAVDLTHNECDCTDYVITCRRVGAACHHILACRLHEAHVGRVQFETEVRQARKAAAEEAAQQAARDEAERRTNVEAAAARAARNARLRASCWEDFGVRA